MYIAIGNLNSIETTTYQNVVTEFNENDPRVVIGLYHVKDSTIRIMEPYMGDDIILSFSKVNDKYVKGTFSSSVQELSEEKKEIILTEGEFCLPRIDLEL